MRMKAERVPKKATKGYTKDGKPAGRPRGGWLDAVDRDAKRTLKCRNWRRSAEDRDPWRRRIGQRPKLGCGLKKKKKKN